MVDFFLNLMDREEIVSNLFNYIQDTSHVLSVCHTLGPPLNYAIICQDIELIVPLINHGAKVTQTVPGYRMWLFDNMTSFRFEKKTEFPNKSSKTNDILPVFFEPK